MLVFKVILTLTIVLSSTAQARSLLLRGAKAQKLLLWSMTSPHGKQDWLLGTWHSLTFNYLAAPTQQALQQLLTQVDVLLHEGIIAKGSAKPIESYQKFDQQLIAMARQLGKETIPLATLTEARQADLDEQHILAEQQAQLRARLTTLSDKEREAEWERVMVAEHAYLQADHDALLLLAQERSAEEKAFDEKLFNTRNRRWVPRIIAACRQEATCLVTAGYLHMLVDNDTTASIITLLREQGYRVEASD